MKNDLITTVAVAVFGFLASFFICNLFTNVEEKNTFQIMTVDTASASDTLAEPDPEVFN